MSEVLHIVVLNGPNLNLLGIREPEKYGSYNLDHIYKQLILNIKTKGYQVEKEYNRGNNKDNIESEELYLCKPYYRRVEFGGNNKSIILDIFQSNSESELINFIHNIYLIKAPNVTVRYIINPAAYGHGSVALRDALLGTNSQFVEVHISNIHAREEFRHKTYLQDIAKGVICGLGVSGYMYALQYWLDQELS